MDPSSCVAEVMGTDLFTLTPDTGVAAALRLASTKRISYFLVIDDGSLTGMVSEGDLKGARRSATIADCMTTPVLCISPETTLEEAAGIMDENAVGCLPVVTGTFLVGVVTRDNLPEDEDEVEGRAAADALVCVTCGSSQNVRRDLRAGLVPLCRSCAGPAGDEARHRAN
jgi:CBS-domain-containing membrane protein